MVPALCAVVVAARRTFALAPLRGAARLPVSFLAFCAAAALIVKWPDPLHTGLRPLARLGRATPWAVAVLRLVPLLPLIRTARTPLRCALIVATTPGRAARIARPVSVSPI